MDYDIDLCYISATEAIKRFKAKTLSPVELLSALISRIESVNPSINAITFKYFDRAREQARDAEARYMRSGNDTRPLEGIAVAIKDFHPVKGEITTFGSRVFETFRPEYTAPTVQRLLDAGGIMHCRSTTPEFAYSGMTHSPLWGITRNPWNTDFVPGGSSGGAGALVASGMTTLADGTDGGGSIRIPASACGIVGYKPPFGRNPLDRDHSGESILQYGPMARTVSDAVLMQNVMSGQHRDDRCSLADRITLPSSYSSIRGLRIAFSMDLGYYSVDTEVRKNTLEALDIFRMLGCEIVEVDVGWTWNTLGAWLTHWESLFASVCGPFLPEWRERMDPIVVAIIERGYRHSGVDLYGVTLHRAAMYQTMGKIFEHCDIFVCPTDVLPSIPVNHDQGDVNFRIDGNVVDPIYGWNMTSPFNLLGECPVINVPSGFASSGIPTGIQLVGKPFADESVFRAATMYEIANPWNASRPQI